jgi:glycosyltransferase involved in cell wall biosynthesis
MRFTFHVLGVPHTKTTEEFSACAFTQKVFKFCKMMTSRGHKVIHYGTAGSNPDCSENVTVLSQETWEEVYGAHDFKNKNFTYDRDDKAYREFIESSIKEIGKRKTPNDFILPFWGPFLKEVCDAHDDLITVEPGIGYSGGHWAQWKVFESYAIMHAYKGIYACGRCNMSHYDVVIPNYFDLKDFECGPDDREDYMLFVGRVYDGKGVNIAIEVTERLGIKLKVAGQPSDQYANPDYKWPDHVEFVGYAGVEERKELMKNAMGSYIPSMYLEPFGGVQIENLLSGTPTITTDWGAFSENNIEGVTGYRCRTFNDFVEATKKLMSKEIDYKECRKKGEQFSLENVAPMYERYFEDVLNVYTGSGWYQIKDSESKKKVRDGKGVTFMVKCHNEESTIGESLESLRGVSIDHEIVVVLHRCTDRSKEIVLEKQKSGLPIIVHEIETPISLPGYQTLVTPDDHPNSLVKYYNKCLSLCNKHWTFKWDADFSCDDNMIKWINNLEERVEEPTNYSIEVDVKSAKKPHREYYLSNCLLKHVKAVFWEDAVFEEGAKCNHLNDFVITSVDSDEVKSYWRKDPWFVGNDHDLEDRFEKLKSMMGEEPLAMCRASHSGWDDEYYKNFISNEESLLQIGANLWG